ncbi:hypothetical protein KZ483_25995 [Paenibacillus sp. sptzw28]|uniref:hypothetical protein n=1 Tax=Paenibacillus sp. sptzw28 TaxID=715179 RepID=UPI001C6F5413|nr:hypothetical protein [Paenibacillus sp. sptzw28]QYR21123.1 hypothetical protein KZ483_25995 [Paenibacillus sp. sptzw28]
MRKIGFMAITVMALSLAVPLTSFAATDSSLVQGDVSNELEQIRLEAINDVLTLNGNTEISAGDLSQTSIELTNDLKSDSVKDNVINEVESLKNIEIVKVVADAEGKISEAISSVEGNVEDRLKYVTETSVESTSVATSMSATKLPTLFTLSKQFSSKRAVTPFVLLTNSNNPAGYETGAFNRQTTPANTSAYTGTFATSVMLPSYDAATAQGDGESALMYTGIGSYVEAGFHSYSGTQGKGWFPYFRVEQGHTDNTGDGHTNSTRGYYYDFGHPQTAGQVISSYKVYYKTSESVLRIRFLVGGTTFYDITVTGQPTTNVRVKRVVSIAINNSPTSTTKFKTPFTSYAKWFDFKFLKNDGTVAVFPSEVTGLSNETWSHGGSIDYIKSGSNPVSESYKIY